MSKEPPIDYWVAVELVHLVQRGYRRLLVVVMT